MSSKLFVGSLAYSIDQDSLKEAFSSYGEVLSATVIMDRETGRSRGFGFVEMASKDEADAAIQGLNGKPLNGRPVIVNEAKNEQRPRTRS